MPTLRSFLLASHLNHAPHGRGRLDGLSDAQSFNSVIQVGYGGSALFPYTANEVGEFIA
jgi:hypothetical protein